LIIFELISERIFDEIFAGGRALPARPRCPPPLNFVFRFAKCAANKNIELVVGNSGEMATDAANMRIISQKGGLH